VRSGTTIVRDLMKPIYIFGRHDAPETFVTQLDVALQKLTAGETFYLRAATKRITSRRNSIAVWA
jgi:hypothetical protein